MLNEPVGEGGEAPEVGEMGAAGEEGAPVNYIQVTPQEKEAIERVSDKYCGRGVPIRGPRLLTPLICFFVLFFS